MVVLKRSKGEWNEQSIKPPKVYKPNLLPGLEFSCKKVFEAAEAKNK